MNKQIKDIGGTKRSTDVSIIILFNYYYYKYL